VKHSLDPKKIKEANIKYHNEFESRIYRDRHLQFLDEEEVEEVKEKLFCIRGKAEKIQGKLLDIGTGIGRILLCLNKGKVIENGFGCDISLGMLSVCQQNARQLGINPSIACTDLDYLPYKKHIFDFIIGGAILHHMPDPLMTLKEVSRIIKPGGEVVFWGEPSRTGHFIVGKIILFLPKAFYRLGKMFVKDQGSKTWSEEDVDVHRFSQRELKEIFLKGGFSNIQITSSGFLRSIWQQFFAPLQGRIIRGDKTLKFIKKVERWLERVDLGIMSRIFPHWIFTEIRIHATK